MKCKNCQGEGGWDIGIPCDSGDTMWIEDGECMELGFKECFWCKGSGKISKERLSEVEKIKSRKH